MVQKKSLVLFISGLVSVTASAAQITKIEYAGVRTEFAQDFLFEQESCEGWKQHCSSRAAHGYCGDHGCPSRGNNNGGGNKGSGGGNGGGNKGGGNNGGNGGNKGGGTKKG